MSTGSVMNISIASYSFYGLLGKGQMDVFGYLETIKYRYHLDTADIWNGMLMQLNQKGYVQFSVGNQTLVLVPYSK